MTSRWVKVVAGAGLIAVAAGLGLAAGLAHAEGIPAAGALVYTGYLETPEGVPVTKAVNLQVNVWTAQMGGSKVCETAPKEVKPEAGRFQIDLPDQCVTAVKANPNLWLELLVDGASLGPTKLGAVPYAIEAGHATSATDADNATKATSAANASAATGALKTTIDGLLPKGTPSAFRVARTSAAPAQSIETGKWATLDFDKIEYDLNSEFDPTTDSFTPKVDGYYQITCGVFFNTTEAALYRAGIDVDAAHVAQALWQSAGTSTTRVATVTMKLTTANKVNCVGFHDAAASATLNSSGFRNFFEAHRIAGL
jgi:hypothetical protein